MFRNDAMMLFYMWAPGYDLPNAAADMSGISIEIWRPELFNVRASGLPVLPYAIWWGFHQLRVFSNSEYGIVIFRHKQSIVHRSLVTPRYFRFANMGKNDVQIGATFTDAEWRGRGFAKMAVRIVCDAWNGRFSRIWYIVEESNISSIRVIEDCGFRLVGKGAKVDRFGTRLFAQYKIQTFLQNQEV